MSQKRKFPLDKYVYVEYNSHRNARKKVNEVSTERGKTLNKPENGQKPIEASGKLECLNHAAAVMLHLGNMLMSNEKIRITIERDPEAGVFTMKREVLS